MKSSGFRTLAEAIYFMGHSGNASIKSVAESLGVSDSYLYRMLNWADGGAHFSPELLVDAMRGFKCEAPLRWMAQALGFMLVRPPRGNASRARLLSDLQIGFAEVVRVLAGPLGELESVRRSPEGGIIDVLWGHMEETAHVRAAVMRRMGQLELEV